MSLRNGFVGRRLTDLLDRAVCALHGRAGTADFTKWTSAADMKAGRYYFKTYANPQVRVVDLTMLDLGRQSSASADQRDAADVR